MMIELKEQATAATRLEDGPPLAEAANQLARAVEDHLEAEERIIPHLLRRAGLAEEDEGQIVQTIVGATEKPLLAIMLPVIVLAMDRAGGYGALSSELFKSRLPPPVQGAFPKFVETMETSNLQVMDVLCQ